VPRRAAHPAGPAAPAAVPVADAAPHGGLPTRAAATAERRPQGREAQPAEPPRSHGRATSRGEACIGFNRPGSSATTWSGLYLRRLGARVLCQAQRELPRFPRAGPDGEYRLAWPSPYSAKRRVWIFPLRLVRTYLQDRRFVSVPGPPESSFPAYLVYPADGNPDILQGALDSIRCVAAVEMRVNSA
jgi:hypothetical protein